MFRLGRADQSVLCLVAGRHLSLNISSMRTQEDIAFPWKFAGAGKVIQGL